jgi:hypothetical protein
MQDELIAKMAELSAKMNEVAGVLRAATERRRALTARLEALLESSAERREPAPDWKSSAGAYQLVARR